MVAVVCEVWVWGGCYLWVNGFDLVGLVFMSEQV